MGRSTSYTESMARRICDELAVHGSLRRVCELNPDFPHDNTVRRWVANAEFQLDGEPFGQAYARAKEAGIDRLVEETLDISDDGSNDWAELTGKKGESLGWTVNGEAVQRSKIRVETRRWLAERTMPKVYGVKSAVDLTNSDGNLKPIDETARAARVATLLAAAERRRGEAPSADDIC